MDMFESIRLPVAQAQGFGGLAGFLPLVIIFAIFYFMLVRPQMRKEKERKKMIEAIKSGDRVLFAGGLVGTIVNIKDQTVMVKVADNVKLEAARGAITAVLDKDAKIEVENNK